MPSLIEKPWFVAVCIPIAILGTSALAITIMLSAYSKNDAKIGKYSIEAIQKAEKQLADKINGLHTGSHEEHAHWSHDTKGVDGPAYWGELGYKIADKGIRQSPINIESTRAFSTSPGLSAIGFHYKGTKTEFKIKNNGHTFRSTVRIR